MSAQFKPVSPIFKVKEEVLILRTPAEATCIRYKKDLVQFAQLLSGSPVNFKSLKKWKTERLESKIVSFSARQNKSGWQHKLEWLEQCSNCQQLVELGRLNDGLCPKCLPLKIPYRSYPPLNP